MRILASGILLLAIASGSPAQDKDKDRGKTPELTKKFVAFMEANTKEVKGIKEDIEKERPEGDIKKRLAKIRDNCAKAKELKYRKDEEDAERLEGHFEIFDLKIKSDFETATWDTKETRLNLLERLKAKCDVCHMDRLRD